MKKVFSFILFLTLLPYISFGQERAEASTADTRKNVVQPYHPEDDAQAKIEELITKAKKEHKNIILQGGGNWCIWCIRFDEFWHQDPELKQLVEANYLYYHLNWSPENKNKALFKKYGDPGKKYGYPVFIILDADGNQLDTQSSAVLESGKSYDREKVKEFFEKWQASS